MKAEAELGHHTHLCSRQSSCIQIGGMPLPMIGACRQGTWAPGQGLGSGRSGHSRVEVSGISWFVHCLFNVYQEKMEKSSRWGEVCSSICGAKYEDPIAARPDRGETRCADMSTPFGGMGVRAPILADADSLTVDIR